MKTVFQKLLTGYELFRKKYATGDQSVMSGLSDAGQSPQIMIFSCCDSRVDPALIFQCAPGDLFVVRNVANIVPPYEPQAEGYCGNRAALEFGVRFLKVKHLVILGHSQCVGVQYLLEGHKKQESDFILRWVSIIDRDNLKTDEGVDAYTKKALQVSYDNCLSFPWVKEQVDRGELAVHLWFFDIKQGEIFTYCDTDKDYLLNPSLRLDR